MANQPLSKQSPRAQLLALIAHAKDSAWLDQIEDPPAALVLFYTMQQMGYELRMLYAEMKVSSPRLAQKGRSLSSTAARGFEIPMPGLHAETIFIGQHGDTMRSAALLAQAKRLGGDDIVVHVKKHSWSREALYPWEAYRPYLASMLTQERLLALVNEGVAYLIASELDEVVPEGQQEMEARRL